MLLVGSMDIPSVKNLKIGIQALDLDAVAGLEARLVLNRANTQVKLDVREIEQVLGMRADFPIPSDIAVPLSVNAGIPVVDARTEGRLPPARSSTWPPRCSARTPRRPSPASPVAGAVPHS